MTGRLMAPLVILLSAALAAVVSILLSIDAGGVGVATGLAAFLVSWLGFAVFPWAVIPVGVVGGTFAAGILGGDVRSFVIIHTVPLAAGCAALLSRRVMGVDRGHYRMPRFGVGMIAILVVVAAGAVYGLALGNDAMLVMISAYQIAVIPAYFFIALFTLTEPHWRRRAAILFVGSLTVLTLIEFTSAERHGGLMAMIAMAPVIVLAGRSQGWQRVALAVLAAVFAADVVLSGYRGLWVGSVLTVLVMIVLGGRSVRQGLIATGIAAAAGFAMYSAFRAGDGLMVARAELIFEAVDRSPGHRLPEAEVGMRVFADRPLFGAGLGQTTPDLYLPGFKVDDVGPLYHAYYVMLLANLGLIGLFVVLWPIVGAALAGLRQRDNLPLAFAALTFGFLAVAWIGGPSDGHWELGLLPALVLLTLPGGPFVEPGERRRRSNTAGSTAPIPLVVTR